MSLWKPVTRPDDHFKQCLSETKTSCDKPARDIVVTLYYYILHIIVIYYYYINYSLRERYVPYYHSNVMLKLNFSS